MRPEGEGHFVMPWLTVPIGGLLGSCVRSTYALRPLVGGDGTR
jgi:hypothetical protein